ncbi:hypothetical protein D3C85_440990 [compost metagenome]
MKVSVNCVDHEIEASELSYEDIVKLTGGDPTRVLTVTYASRNGRDGSLTFGQTVEVVERLHINVAHTGNA